MNVIVSIYNKVYDTGSFFVEDDSFSDKVKNESTFEQYFRSRPKRQGKSIMCGYDIKRLYCNESW